MARSRVTLPAFTHNLRSCSFLAAIVCLDHNPRLFLLECLRSLLERLRTSFSCRGTSEIGKNVENLHTAVSSRAEGIPSHIGKVFIDKLLPLRQFAVIGNNKNACIIGAFKKISILMS